MPQVELREPDSKSEIKVAGPYCVYNQTSESFLSLAVNPGGGFLARLRGIFSKSARGTAEGVWVKDPGWLDTFGMSTRRDLVYVDDDHKVVDVFEGFCGLRLARARAKASTLLILPHYTIVASLTRPGNQLLICVAEEMQFRLRELPKPGTDSIEANPAMFTPAAMDEWFAKKAKPDRRKASRKRWPRLVAYDASGEAVKVHGVRDISATGLYLLTEERWPLGTQIKMSLQPTDGHPDDSLQPITVDLKVSRWGTDGLGLEFLHTHVEQVARLAQVR